MRARARRRAGGGSGYSFTVGCALALAVVVLLWLAWLVVSSLRSDATARPATPTAPPRAAPILVATTQPLPTPPPPASATPTAVPTPVPPTPVVIVVVPPTPVVVVVAPPTAAPPVVAPTPPVVLLPTATSRPLLPTPTPAPPLPTPTAEPARIGQSVESAGLVLTVDSASRQAEIDPATRPGADHVFLVVEAALESRRGDLPVPYAPTDFVVRDGSGAEHETLVPFGPGAFRAGQLDPAGRVAGRLVFEVPNDARAFVLRYQPAVALPGFTPIRVLLGD